jgi:hypothetical protein
MSFLRVLFGLRYFASLVVFTALFVGSASASQQEEKEPVRAKKPTVVTVEGKAEPVETDQASQPKPNDTGVGGAIKKVWRGVVGFTGWMFNVDNDIPAERERRERRESESKRSARQGR